MGDADLCPVATHPSSDFETLFLEAEALKKGCVISGLGDVNIGSPKWEVRQELQDAYRNLLLTNLEMSIKNGIEMDLWRYTCYNFISRMQQHLAQYKSIAGLYKIFLNASTGFFSQLLQELCEVYKKKIRAMPSSRYLGLIQDSGSPQMVEEHFKYICHFCLVKLGDIARYHNDSNCAKVFYQQALHVKPLNGQPYNQLAILSATNKDEVETLYLHVRSIAVSFPFPAGPANLNNWLLKCVSDVKTSDKLHVNFHFLVFRVLHEREPMTLGELCKDFLEETKGRMKIPNRPFGDLFLKLVAILIYLHQKSLTKGEEYQAPVYGLIVEFMSVLASEAEENSRAEATRELLPALVIMAHWFQKNYTRDRDDLVPASLWADLHSFVKKQAEVPDDDKNVARATLEEEELRAFGPLQDVLKMLATCDKTVNMNVIRVMRLRNLLHWGHINKMTTFEQDVLLNNKSLTFGEEKLSSQFNNVPMSPMFVPYQMMQSAPLPYPINPAEAAPHRAPFPPPEPPFMPPPETQQRPSFLQQYPSVMYHDMAAMSLPGLHDSRKQETRDFSPQSFLPPPHGPVQSFIQPNKFLANSKFLPQTSVEEKPVMSHAVRPPLMSHLPPAAPPHIPPQVDQRSLYRHNPMFTGPFMQRPGNAIGNTSQFPVNNNSQFPVNNNSQFPVNTNSQFPVNNNLHFPMNNNSGGGQFPASTLYNAPTPGNQVNEHVTVSGAIQILLTLDYGHCVS